MTRTTRRRRRSGSLLNAWIASVCWALATCVAGSALAVPCATGEVTVARTTRVRAYTQGPTDSWQPGINTWYRDTDWACDLITFTTTTCYPGWWDAFWKQNATKSSFSTQSTPDGTRTTRETRWFCVNVPSDTIVFDDWGELENADGIASQSPGSIPHAFAQAAQAIGRPGEGLDVPNATFDQALFARGSGFTEAAGLFHELYLAALDVSIADQVRADEILFELSVAFGEIGETMTENAFPTNTSNPFNTAGNLFAELASYPAFQGQEPWDSGSVHMFITVKSFFDIAERAASGFSDDNQRREFLEAVEDARLGLFAFAVALDQGCLDDDADGACLLTDCDPSDGNTYPGAPEVNDGKDNQCPGDVGFGAIDEISGASGFGDPEMFCWAPQIGATTYEVAAAGESSFADSCASSVTAETCVGVADPAEGAATFLLVRPLEPLLGSWGADSSGKDRAVTCP